ncbi:hypothetical protein [Pontibacter chinhatensis]|uniref:Uncharacterized protein n=1 Tax=Pontibacter chinhatensis TaxID=1436961 RepID=A0A1I2NQZ5_9BACT|nr:hypothetical protein [Pontibacter chinhatensis]SFG06138.1 hypothetical protein SAMN05421739_101818 [Pontibacter chinhatensis]
MENLIQYLDDALVPLEKKVIEYLNLEKDIRKQEVDMLTKKGPVEEAAKNTATTLQEVPDISEDQLQEMRQRLETLRAEIVAMLPEKDKFIEVNLGYGPSMVGYFTTDHETHQPLPEPILRVVH